MKKIILFLLFSSFVTAQDYSNLFSSLDSIQKKEAYSHLRKVKKLINYEIIKKEGTINKNDYIKGVFFLDNQGKFSLIILDDKSKKYQEIISRIISKLPVPYCHKYYNEYISFRFNLTEISNLESYYIELMEDKQNIPKAFAELSTYPAFKKHKFLDNKDKALELFFKSMSEHIKNNLKYPEKAMDENIQGKTNVYFLISKEGIINEIYAFNAHPLLQLEGIRIIELLPKIIPGSLDGKNVNVTYAQPMTFKIQ